MDSGVLALDRSLLDLLHIVVYWPCELYSLPFTTPLERPSGGAAGMLMHSLLALDAAQDELRACRTGRRASEATPQVQALTKGPQPPRVCVVVSIDKNGTRIPPSR